MSNLLEVENLTVRFDTPAGTVHAVNGVSYAVKRGEILGIVGESGSGKTVHALSMVRLLSSKSVRIADGSVRFEGTDLLKLSPRDMADVLGAKIGLVFQDPMSSLNPVLPIGRQIAEPLRRHMGLSSTAAARRTAELLDLVGIRDPRVRMKQYPHQLSGGMRQRVMIAIGVACEPKLLIADEPTTALDVTVQAQIVDLVKSLKHKIGFSVIWITHDMGVVAGLADTLQVMYAGRVIERGPTEAVFADPRNAYTWGLLNSLPLSERHDGKRLYQIPGGAPNLLDLPAGDPFAPRNKFATARCASEMPPLAQAVDSVPGHEVAAWYDLRASLRQASHPSSTPAQAQPIEAQAVEAAARTEPLLRVSGLTKSFTARTGWLGRKTTMTAVDNISFEVFRGETVGLVGESGSGKSTTSRMLMQLEAASAGDIYFDGVNLKLAAKRELQAIRRRMQMVFQDPYSALNPKLTVGTFVAEPLIVHGIETDARAVQRRVDELFEMVGLDPAVKRRYPHEFSGGQRQRINIARAIATRPELIIADESIAALDVSIQAQIVNLMQDLQRAMKVTYLFVAHDLGMIRHMCDRVMVMLRGRIVEVGRTSDVFGRPAHPYTQALLSSMPVPDPAVERKRSRKALSTTDFRLPSAGTLSSVGAEHFVLR